MRAAIRTNRRPSIALGIGFAVATLMSMPRTARAAPAVTASAAPAVTASAAPAPAASAPAAPAAEARPWAAGVSEIEQARALELYTAGNLEFGELRFAQALAKYREALRHWDHPAIRYNVAVCLINLEQLIEAKEHLDKGLAYGALPLEADKYTQGLLYRQRLEAQLGQIELAIADRGITVTLDGKLLSKEPGVVRQFLLPGPHLLVATRGGFVTLSQTLELPTGKLTRFSLRTTLALYDSEVRPILALDPASIPPAPAQAATPRTAPRAAAPPAPRPAPSPASPPR